MLAQRSISLLNTCKTCSSSSKFSFLFPNNRSLLLLTTLSFSKSRPLNTPKIRAFGAAAVSAVRNGSDSDTFLAEDSVSWASLGVSESLSQALSNVGLHRPSSVQAACIPAILAGADVVVAAETGSGKTHGYLIPIIHKLCSTVNMSGTDDNSPYKHHHVSLILCPNVMLCEQVVRMANSLHNGAGELLLKTAAICGRQGLPVKEPDVIVSTPVALLNYLYAIDVDKHRRADFIRNVKHVVFDEADLLLCGSFQNQIVRLINMLRFDEKLLSRLKNGEIRAEDAVDLAAKAITEDQEDVEADHVLEEDEDIDDKSVVEDFKTESEVRNKRDWRRVRKIYDRSKQYIFVAATLPLNGKRTAGGTLKRMFPDANWVSGSYLHCQNPRLEQKWVEVTTDTQVDALINAVNNGLNTRKTSADGIVRTMVFVNTVEAAEAVAKILTGAGIRCLRYHSDVSLEERAANIVGFQQEGGVFVCTDAAARGLDVPNVSHVIQAEFASSAVDFLHRVGRTARAGQDGVVTSLFTASNRDLVAAVRRAEEQGLPVEKAFSRKRGFRNKLKKGLSRRGDASSREQVPA